MDFRSFGRQTWALTRKNLLIAAVRKWFSTLLWSLVLPLALLVLLLEFQNFSRDGNRYGVGDPHPIRSLADSLAATPRKLVFVQSPGLGPDFRPVFDQLVRPLSPGQLVHLEDAGQIEATCPVDYHGNSPCHAVVTFRDSPLSGRVNATWNYTISTDPASGSGGFNVFSTDDPPDRILLPLQAAIENAMANLTVSPDVMAYTARDQQQAEEDARISFISMAIYILSYVYYLTFFSVGHHVAGMIASERESGMSDLIDAMSGGMAWPRVLSYILTFDILYLPLWIIMGALYSHLLLPNQSAAITIFWQIFTGWATTSASVFGASFFKKSTFASLWVSLIPFLLAVCASFTENTYDPAPLGQHELIYFFNAICKSQAAGISLSTREPSPLSSSLGSIVSGQGRQVNWIYITGPYSLWILLAVQIVVYPLLAILVETTPEATGSHIAIETRDLVKHYHPLPLRKLFCCCARTRTQVTKAVDGLNLVSQKRQILCLLGPNGSGKTTMLNMLAGFQRPTGGSVSINASPSQMGIRPQQNVMWDQLTVYEHLSIWNCLKGNVEDAAALDRLIEKCDLVLKKNSLAGSLSGGMKRKLQLACMLVGGSSICLMDEVTSGLDPLSRRVIWNVILSERSRRTMVLSTHFLDECEVLSDHVVIITLGKLKCQGTLAELKNQYGGGYRVYVPKTEDVSAVPYPIAEERDKFICRTPDSASAARLLGSLPNAKNEEVYITGPTIEDVFLKVSEEPHTLIGEKVEEISISDAQPSRQRGPQVEPPLWLTYSQQIQALFVKRIQVLRSNWWPYLFALAIPLIATYFLGELLRDYETPDCNKLVSFASREQRMSIRSTGNLALGPESLNDTVAQIIDDLFGIIRYEWETGPFVQNSRVELEDFVRTHGRNITSGGGIWMGDDNSAPLIAYTPLYGINSPELLNMLNQARSGVPIAGYTSSLRSYHQAEGGESVTYVTIFCLLHTLYPAFFALYPAFERRSLVRGLQYSNGVRPFPLLFSYWMFDFMFVLVICAASTAMVAPAAPWFGPGYVWFAQVLYGLAATLFAYLVSLVARSQSSAFAFSVLFMCIMYALSVVTLVVLQTTDGANQMANDGTTFGLGITFPIQNLMRALAISLNMYIIRCRGQTMITDGGSIYAYGGPIMLLILQNISLFTLLLWLEGGSFAWLRRTKALPPAISTADIEMTGVSPAGRPDVDAETTRVEASKSDLLRILHVLKNFGSNIAVDNVSLGLQEGEILALLGPNGAGKTTIINMVRGDLIPSSGRIYLEGVDVLQHRRLAQKHLGVCPQFDALDLLTVREHLVFYARCKGVPDVADAVSRVMSRVGLTAHAAKLGSRLSGGNKRKLSLAIALLGDPPVLLLDEPSSAMDAASKRVLWRALLAAVAPGRSVLLTTHSMEEADALATRAAIIAGRVLAVGSTQALRRAHSNEYHVHLILRSAPPSGVEEMRGIEDWARRTFGGAVRFEGESLGGQVRFLVPADSEVPSPAAPSGARWPLDGSAGDDDGVVSPISPATPHTATRSFTRYLIDTLEAHKDELGIDCYSISAATMESVFVKVVKESDAAEDERTEMKRRWQR
ncbi:P-loop containing nucleoside triphosphate hydrolase protein [Durotheca rogersii]|uniref:P-loop containing nucleoside triphosphate hydrolase protein n=1 Tax=Durotheca rogersii TaxID=419775 RepID=UPI00221F2FA1|nr:P-loop containing nucleoside triphosphate hydrolase protein [Durotheca rogersii]KAI5853669.1 P-loop containing nucleoside triphosphate hydrolase protein [Durotheca rogersii]